jgi:hypothetical protein
VNSFIESNLDGPSDSLFSPQLQLQAGLEIGCRWARFQSIPTTQPIGDLSGAHGVPFAFTVEPGPHRVQLSLKMGEDEPHQLLFATEADAATFLGRSFKAMKLWESALSLPLR